MELAVATKAHQYPQPRFHHQLSPQNACTLPPRSVVLSDGSTYTVECNASTAEWQWRHANSSSVPPVGPPNRTALGRCVRTYSFNENVEHDRGDSRVFAYGQYGWGSTDFGLVGGQTRYGRGGYVAFLPPGNKAAAAAIIDGPLAPPRADQPASSSRAPRGS
jgi:hypothetical protein